MGAKKKKEDFSKTPGRKDIDQTPVVGVSLLKYTPK